VYFHIAKMFGNKYAEIGQRVNLNPSARRTDNGLATRFRYADLIDSRSFTSGINWEDTHMKTTHLVLSEEEALFLRAVQDETMRRAVIALLEDAEAFERSAE
jgi:hypothetical protein